MDVPVGRQRLWPPSDAVSGKSLAILCGTTSIQEMVPEALAKKPVPGRFLVLDAGGHGIPLPRFAGWRRKGDGDDR